MNRQESLKDKIDWTTVVVPFALIAFLCAGFIFVPEQSSNIIAQIRFLLGDTLGLYYLIIGLGVFLLSIYLAFSKYGSIRLGRPDEKPKYKDFTWASMMFTAGLAADILFYSICEWIQRILLTKKCKQLNCILICSKYMSFCILKRLYDLGLENSSGVPARIAAVFKAFQPTVARWSRGSPEPAEPSCLIIVLRPPPSTSVIP